MPFSFCLELHTNNFQEKSTLLIPIDPGIDECEETHFNNYFHDNANNLSLLFI